MKTIESFSRKGFHHKDRSFPHLSIPQGMENFSLITDIFKTAQIWSWYLANRNGKSYHSYPINSLTLVNTHPTFKNINEHTDKIDFFLSGGVGNLSPALLRVHSKKQQSIENEEMETWFCNEIVAEYNLTMKYASFEDTSWMLDAGEFFKTRDNASLAYIKSIHEKYGDDSTEGISIATVKDQIHSSFTAVLFAIFRGMFKDIPYDFPQGEEFAEAKDRLYNILSELFVIKEFTMESIDPENPSCNKTPICLVSHLQDYDGIANAVTDKIDWRIKKCPYLRDRDSLIEFLSSPFTPLMIASLHHTAFREEYYSTRKIIERVTAQRDANFQNDLEDTVKSWT